MLPSALHGALRLSMAAHPPHGRQMHGNNRRRAGCTARRAGRRAPRCALRPRCSLLAGVFRSPGSMRPHDPAACAHDGAAASRRGSCKRKPPPALRVRMRCACCVRARRVLVARGREKSSGVCHHHKETPLLQHTAHSAAASWGMTRLTAPCLGPAATATHNLLHCEPARHPPLRRTSSCAPMRRGVCVGKCWHPSAPARDGGGERRQAGRHVHQDRQDWADVTPVP